MANRCYLYSVNKEKSNYIGISEWAYEIPIVFKILLSGNPRACRSAIWPEYEGKIAIEADALIGISKLDEFLSRIKLPEVNEMKQEAMDFLHDTNNLQDAFILEGGEIFDMVSEDLEAENVALLNEISDIDLLIDKALADLVRATKPSFFSKLLKKKQNNKEILWNLGLGFWGNVLYYDLSKTDT